MASFINNFIYVKYEKPNQFYQTDFLSLGVSKDSKDPRHLTSEDIEKLQLELRKLIEKYNKKLKKD